MLSRSALALSASLGLSLGCAAAPPAASVPPAASSSVPVAPEPPAPSSAASVPPPPVAEVPVVPPPPAIGPICEAKCDKLVPRCGKSAVESCRLNCGKYDPPPAGCAEQVKLALECARDAKDLTCANVAPESCSAKFREIAACSSGVPTQKVAETPAGPPAGWERVTDAVNGFSVAVPHGSAEKKPGEALRVTAPDGTSYSVSVLPVPTEKPSEKTLLHLMMKLTGKCSPKLKLDGFVEKAGRSSIHYTTHCPDQTDWNGMVYIGPKNLILLSAQAPTGKIGPTEPFFYGFEQL